MKQRILNPISYMFVVTRNVCLIIISTPVILRKRGIISLILLLNFAVSKAQPDLENTIPANYTASKGILSTSDRHYQLGVKSLRWDWKPGDTLTIELSESDKAYINANLWTWALNHFELWAYNETAGKDTFDVKFMNWQGLDQFRFTFNVNYTGWRRMLRSYRHDMLKREIKQYDPNYNVDKIFIIAPSKGNGSLFLDNIQYMRAAEMKQSDYQMPDLYELANSKSFSSDLYYQIDSLDRSILSTTPTNEELQSLSPIRQKIIERGLQDTYAPSNSDLNSANALYGTYNIITTGDFIKGKHIATPGQIGGMFDVFARSYLKNNNTDSRDKLINLLQLMEDGGLAAGSGTWFAGSYSGYDDTAFYAALLNAYSFIPPTLRTQTWNWLKWSIGIDLGWLDETNGLFDTDNFVVLRDAFWCAVLYSPDDASTIKVLKCFKQYIEKFLKPQKGNTDGMKVDGTGFHHQAHYNAYMYSFAFLLSASLSILQDTPFQIDAEAYYNLRKVVYAQYIMSNKTEYANSLSGRRPFQFEMSFYQRHYTVLANTGGDVLNKPYDPVVAGMYNRVFGNDGQFSGVSAEPFPSGFWQMNYSPVSIYRRDNWAATIKGMNNYFWGSEIYADANRYGRYQSYGAVEVMYPGGLAASGENALGWDWNKIPGTTAIVYPFDSLRVPPAQDKLEERNVLNFAGGVRFNEPKVAAPSDIVLSSLHGDYGMFGLAFIQPDGLTPTHSSSFVFRKSFFCFGNKIICIGSNIYNNRSWRKTITTLFQNNIPTAATQIVADGIPKSGASMSQDLDKSDPHWLIDGYKTGYYVLGGNTIHVERQSQTSPDQSGSGATSSGLFANAYIDHGNAPLAGKYAYVIAPNTTAVQMEQFTNDMATQSTRPFDIIQQDSSAHVIKENATGVMGFSLFLPNSDLNNNEIVKGNDRPCVLMAQIKNDTLRISLVNPDLNLVNNVSTALPITLTLYGNWIKAAGIPPVYASLISSETTQTSVRFSSADGLPGSITLVKVNDIILPVSLLSFTGYESAEGSRNILDLTIETDENVIYYLERSTSDAGAWTIIDSHSFTGVTGEQKFVFFDANLVSNTNLYRVKRQDASGEWKYSNIVKLNRKQKDAIVVAPNPARDNMYIRFKEKPEKGLNWILIDAAGKIVKYGKFVNANEVIPVSGLAEGNYFLKLDSEENIKVSVLH